MQASLDSLKHPAGMQNDIDVFCRAPWAEPQKINCPLLVLHDPLDTFVPFEHSKWLAEQVPQAKLQELHCGGHLLWTGPEKDRFGDLRRDYLKSYCFA
jgi:pimeloyl-ACP methyl ester carboxylesterase